MKHLFFIFSAILFLQTGTAQTIRTGSGDVQQSLERLAVVGRVLYIAAHPDDENTRLLAYLANERKTRTAYLSLTRGDGGQNLIGKEQGEALGLIRTQELLAARRTDGAEQFFTRANDFGYSKNPEETFRIWNHDSVLSDVVYVIRQFRPDVIICRFPTTGEGGHGHHTASAILAQEAFEAAADPNQFAWQLSYVDVWKPKRLLWNTFNFGGTNTTSPDQFKIETGVYNNLLGKSYGEVAAESRSMHKSQGFGSAKQRGSAIEYFKTIKGEKPETDLFDGIDISWKRILGTESINSAIAECVKLYDSKNPQNSVPALLKIRKQLLALPGNDYETLFIRNYKLKEIEELIVNCSGIWAEAFSAKPFVVPGQTLTYTVQLLNRLTDNISFSNIKFATGNDSATNIRPQQNEMITVKRSESISPFTNISVPYWLQKEKTIGSYIVSDRSKIGLAENEAALAVEIKLSVLGETLEIKRPIVYKTTDPVKGEIYRALEILPALTINPDATNYVFGKSGKKQVKVTLRSNTTNCTGSLHAVIPAGYTISPQQVNFSLNSGSEESVIQFTLQAEPGAKDQNLKFFAVLGSDTLRHLIKRINYDHIPAQFYLEPAECKVVCVSTEIKKNTRIAYLPGAGDEVANSLQQVGFDVDIISEEQLKTTDLSVYKALVTGVRAFNTNEKLYLYKDQLLNYMKNGGNLLVQYNTNSRVGPLQGNIGPYPFTISRERVTDETANVNFTHADHPVLNYPNKIQAADFEGWVQERGIYFASDIDSHYQTVFEMHDPNEKPAAGSLITCAYGKGNFVYTGLAFFRELPAAVPGAYRLFTNLIYLPQHK